MNARDEAVGAPWTEGPAEAPGAALAAPPLGRYRVWIRPFHPIRCDEPWGGLWRQAFGRALRRVCCQTRLRSCDPCPMREHCVYPYLLETRRGVEGLTSREPVPRPFILQVDEPQAAALPVRPGGELCVGFVLVGRANLHLGLVTDALRRASFYGLGPERVRFQLLEVEMETLLGSGRWVSVARRDAVDPEELAVPEPPPFPGAVRVRFATPTRLKTGGRGIRPDTFRLGHLFGSLLRRLALLRQFHADGEPPEGVDSLLALARTLEPARAELRWESWLRPGRRQEGTVRMGGILGWLDITDPRLEPLWPYLWMGQWIHVGRGTGMGLGRLALTPLGEEEGPRPA